VLAVITFGILWLFFAKIDIVVSARGKVIPTGEIKVLQPIETGVISKINIKEGDFVKKGQILMQIDPSVTENNLEVKQKDLAILNLQITRIEALINNKALFLNSRHKENKMAFILEKPSEEDKANTTIRALKKKYYEMDNMRFTEDDAGNIKWMIDREREIWFSEMVQLHLDDHREGWKEDIYFILHYKNTDIEVVLKKIRDKETSLKVYHNPFIIKWKLLSINEKHIKDLDYDEVIAVLKEVLQAYGIGDLYCKVPKENIQVTLEV
jgi:hypothetical protein